MKDLGLDSLDPLEGSDVSDNEWALKYWKGPLLLMHGMQSNADNWLNSTPGTTLPMILSDLGYEVWVCNNRGVFEYSGHKTLDPYKDDEFWNYDWQMMAAEDLAALTGAAYQGQTAPEGA